MSMFRIISYVVKKKKNGEGCLLLPVCSYDKTLLAFALLHFVLQGQTCLILQDSLDFLFCIPTPCDEKDIFFFFFGIIYKGLVGLHRKIQLQLIQD